MQRQQILGGLVLLALTAAGIGLAGAMPDKQTEEFAAYEELPDAVPVAKIEGEALSPSGRFEVRTVGASDLYVSGLRVPEEIQIVDTRTGEVRWSDSGYAWQSVLWSPGNNFVALAYGGRTWNEIKVLSTAYWTSWDFTLPDGEAIPEYTFLPEDWGEWLDPDTLLLTVGRGGDAGEQKTYRCYVSTSPQSEEISGSVLEQTVETLSGTYDFDHDGLAETVELATVLTPETPYFPAWYELNIRKADGTKLWSANDITLPHGGYTSVYACKLDEEDYLLQYEPEMWQGWADYSYRLFSLDENGEALVRETAVSFDCNFRENGHSFDTEAIADFLWDLRGCLADSRLLISTEGGTLYTDGAVSPAEVPAYLSELLALDSRAAMLEALRRDEAQFKWEQGIE